MERNNIYRENGVLTNDEISNVEKVLDALKEKGIIKHFRMRTVRPNEPNEFGVSFLYDVFHMQNAKRHSFIVSFSVEREVVSLSDKMIFPIEYAAAPKELENYLTLEIEDLKKKVASGSARFEPAEVAAELRAEDILAELVRLKLIDKFEKANQHHNASLAVYFRGKRIFLKVMTSRDAQNEHCKIASDIPSIVVSADRNDVWVAGVIYAICAMVFVGGAPKEYLHLY